MTGINLDSEAKQRFQKESEKDLWEKLIQDVVEEAVKQVLKKFTSTPTIDNNPTTITKQVLESLVNVKSTQFQVAVDRQNKKAHFYTFKEMVA